MGLLNSNSLFNQLRMPTGGTTLPGTMADTQPQSFQNNNINTLGGVGLLNRLPHNALPNTAPSTSAPTPMSTTPPATTGTAPAMIGQGDTLQGFIQRLLTQGLHNRAQMPQPQPLDPMVLQMLMQRLGQGQNQRLPVNPMDYLQRR